MGIFFSLLYAPIVFFSLQHFDIKSVALLISFSSLLWLISLEKKWDLFALFPLFYFFVGVIAYFTELFTVIKLLPLFLSIFFSLILLFSYLKKDSLILYFVKRFGRIDIDKKEETYIQESTIFWFFATLVNVFFHLSVFFQDNLSFWLYYSSIGWYFVFLFTGVIQFIHRHFIFLRRKNV